jgi:hypothetical protein
MGGNERGMHVSEGIKNVIGGEFIIKCKFQKVS